MHTCPSAYHHHMHSLPHPQLPSLLTPLLWCCCRLPVSSSGCNRCPLPTPCITRSNKPLSQRLQQTVCCSSQHQQQQHFKNHNHHKQASALLLWYLVFSSIFLPDLSMFGHPGCHLLELGRGYGITWGGGGQLPIVPTVDIQMSTVDEQPIFPVLYFVSVWSTTPRGPSGWMD